MSRRPRRAEAAPAATPTGDVELAAFLAWLGAGEVPPSIDRWVGEWLRSVGLARDPRAAGVVAFLDAAVAWGTLAAFSPFRSRNRSPEAAVLKFAAAVRRPRELLQLWRAADAAFAARIRAFAADDDPTGDAAALARVAAEAEDPELRLYARLLRSGIPPWHAPAITRRLERSGEDWAERWFAAQSRRPPLWLRVAEPRHTASVRDMLASEGLRIAHQDGAALAVVGSTPVFRTRAWREGKVEIQDLASQRVGEAVPAGPGQLVWDACAGTGGKTMQLWARLGGRGAIHASDAAPARLSELRKRLTRVDGRNVRVWPWDGRGPPALPEEVNLRGGFDAVLVDAPCSGSGTWRRRPDARMRSVASAIPRWAAQQGELLDAAAPAVRPGGALVYATCSVWVEENESAIEAFCARHPAWSVEREALIGAPDLDADSLFVAVLRRG
ncbi:hypothetical protein LBMAG42_17460 [Deltaproteobacteria bacterium]|nr:hypothetical protein LBMAG42_17460 [Deltaproteobacteria bacterium]